MRWASRALMRSRSCCSAPSWPLCITASRLVYPRLRAACVSAMLRASISGYLLIVMSPIMRRPAGRLGSGIPWFPVLAAWFRMVVLFSCRRRPYRWSCRRRPAGSKADPFETCRFTRTRPRALLTLPACRPNARVCRRSSTSILLLLWTCRGPLLRRFQRAGRWWPVT